MKYHIIPRPRTEFVYEAKSAEGAMVDFATNMDMDMNIYFVAVPEDQYEEYCHQEDAKAHKRFVKAFMKNVVMDDFPVYDEDIAGEITEKAYEIYSEGDGDTEYESVQKAYDERYNAKITISDIQWDWDRDMVCEKVDSLDTIADTISLFKLNPHAACDAEGNDEAIYDLCVDSLRHNRVTAEEVFDLPETIEFPGTLGDEQITEYIAEEYGFCVSGYTRSDDNSGEIGVSAEHQPTISSKDICLICDWIEKYSKGYKDIQKKEWITDKIIEAYKYAAEIGIREGYKSEKDIEEDKRLINEDLDDCPNKVLVTIELLGMDLFDEERLNLQRKNNVRHEQLTCEEVPTKEAVISVDGKTKTVLIAKESDKGAATAAGIDKGIYCYVPKDIFYSTEAAINQFIQESVPGRLPREEFEKACYEAYKLNWMLSRGYTLQNYLMAIADEDDAARYEGEYPEGNTWEIFEALNDSFEETGFDGSLWACFDEFMDTEFQDREYMENLLQMMPRHMLEFYRKNY